MIFFLKLCLFSNDYLETNYYTGQFSLSRDLKIVQIYYHYITKQTLDGVTMAILKHSTLLKPTDVKNWVTSPKQIVKINWKWVKSDNLSHPETFLGWKTKTYIFNPENNLFAKCFVFQICHFLYSIRLDFSCFRKN